MENPYVGPGSGAECQTALVQRHTIPGHHGYNAYKGQSFHWLHHRYFECNYGSELVPFDHMFGTYRKSL